MLSSNILTATQSESDQCIGHRAGHFCPRPAEVRLAEFLHKSFVWPAAGLKTLGCKPDHFSGFFSQAWAREKSLAVTTLAG